MPTDERTGRKGVDHTLKPGNVPNEQFDLLLSGTSIRSEALIQALKDHLVNGSAASEAMTRNGINPGQFYRRLSVVQAESLRAKALSKFYLKR